MAAHVTIYQDRTNFPYGMRFYYSPSTEKWILSFDCMRPTVSHSEEYPYNTFEEVRRHFINNCRYYGVDVPEDLPSSEEEFFGVPEGTIFPAAKMPKSKKVFSYLEAHR